MPTDTPGELRSTVIKNQTWLQKNTGGTIVRDFYAALGSIVGSDYYRKASRKIAPLALCLDPFLSEPQ